MENQKITNRASRLKIIFIFCLFLWSNAQNAQTIDPTYISISEGLASPGVNAVLQDSYGLIWIGTLNGLQKYDGIRFETFKNIPGKPTSLLNNMVWGLTEDEAHNIWVANSQGISRYNRSKKTFTNYNIAQKFNVAGEAGMVLNIHSDSQKRLWATTVSVGLLLYNPNTDSWDQAKYDLTNPNYENGRSDFTLGFTEDSQGGIWIGSFRHGLLYLAKKESDFKQIPINTINYTIFIEGFNYITSLYADTANVIWITTRNGVYKYRPADGVIKTIKEYQERQDMNSDFHNSILEDNKGNIWISNNSRGILKFDGISDDFQEMSVTGSYKLKNIGWSITLTDFMIDKSGIFWIGSLNKGLIKFDPEKKPFFHYTHDDNNPSSISMNGVFGLAASRVKPDLIYVGTRGTGLNIFDQQKQTFRKISYTAKNDEYGGAVRSIGENDDGALWLGTWGDGLIELDKNYNEIRRYTYYSTSETSISDNKVRVIKKDTKGNFWIGTNNGLNYFQPKKGEFKRFYGKQLTSYAGQLIKSAEDLAVSDHKVAGILNVTDFQNLSEAFEVKQAGNYLVFNVGEGDYGKMVDYGWIENMQKDTLWSAADYDKSLYAGGAVKNRIIIEKINLPAGKYQLRYQSDDSHSHDKWNDAKPDKTSFYGIILIKINNQNMLNTLDTDFKKTTETHELSGNNISAIAVAEKHIWVGTNPDGLNRIDLQTNEVKIYKHDPANENSLSSNIIFDVYEDNKGIVWITTDSGINRFDPKAEQFTRYTEEDGLPTNVTQSILPGDNGEMWISTQNGLSQMVTSESLGKVTFINYQAGDGLGGETFISQAAARSADGRFYFGGDHGLNAVSKVTANKVAPDLILSNLLLSNKSVYEMGDKSPISSDLLDVEEIKLSYDQNNLSFEFAALHYADPKKNQYAHMLKGYDTDWVYDNRNFATYTNLDPGTYEFMIRASNAYGVWNEKGKSMRIIITPPWWRTWWAYALYGLLLMMGVFVFDRLLRKRLLEKEHRLAKERELEHAREIEKAYIDLKAAQAQLIQSEKMASLGELTAGIAHEIQNPLNFVNNFSEVSNELIDEMKDEFKKGETEEGFAIADDIKQNLEKILHHGKRADAIVKGMLQHSRASSSQKEATDINVLADEYLRLTYHGLRAKDKSFNAEFKTDFHPNLPKINIIPQDIGRVIINLITNAFYAVNERKKKGESDYVPTVTVNTKKVGDKIEIKVTDNGKGIPENIIEKIFQPFFTTKPAGQGTGLGLSLAYDIVKAHGGELKVETKEGEGSTFSIQLPI